MIVSPATCRIVSVSIGAVLLIASLVYILGTFHWRQIGVILIGTDLTWFLGGGIATILVYWLLRTARWALLLRGKNRHTSFGELYLSTAISLGFAILTPLQSGEIAKVEWLKRRGDIERLSGYSAYAVERILDLLVVCAFGLTGLIPKMSPIMSGNRWLPWLLAGFVVVIAVLIMLLRKLHLDGLLRRFLGSILALLRETKLLMGIILLTVASWAVVAAGWYACLRSVSITLRAADSFALVAVVTLANMLSIIPGALGVSEVGVTEFLLAIGEEPATAQAGAVMVRAYGLLILAVAVFHFLFFKAIALTARSRANASRNLAR